MFKHCARTARPVVRAARPSAPRFASTATPRNRLGHGIGVGLGLTAATISLGAILAGITQAQADAVARKGRTVSLDELGRHHQPTNAWVAIDGKVYEVFDFVEQHPGGVQILLENAGRDVSALFHAIHKPTTLRKFVEEGSVKLVGELDEKAVGILNSARSEQTQRMAEARNKLFGVDSVVALSDFERYAKDLLPMEAWAYYSTGADTEEAFRENRDIFKRIFLRPRVMRDVSSVDTSTTVLGVPSSIPVYVSPTARNGMGNPEGEAAVARGAGAAGILQVLSHYASRSLDEVKAAAQEGQPIGWQLYLQPDRKISEQHVKEAVANGAHSIWITVDTVSLGKRETERRMNAEAKPAPNGKPLTRPAINYGFSVHEPAMSWNDIAFVRKLAPGLPVVIKGIGAWEDVLLAYEHGADGVVLSNHGGRQLNYAQPPMKTLYDVHQNAPAILHKKNFDVFIDGGIRSGTDVIKALCLGAKAVGLGRPIIFALTGWGSDGVERLAQIMEEEIALAMKLMGVTKVQDLGPEYLDLSRINT